MHKNSRLEFDEVLLSFVHNCLHPKVVNKTNEHIRSLSCLTDLCSFSFFLFLSPRTSSNDLLDLNCMSH